MGPSAKWNRSVPGCRAFLFIIIANAAAGQNRIPTFGTTVVDNSGLRGEVYEISSDSEELPNFKRLHSVGSIYTTRLDIAPRGFTQGFPGVTGRVEWFAIDYHGRIWVDTPRVLRFGVQSDDGSKLYLDGRLVIDNDGLHPPRGCSGQAELARGVHNIRLSYFQGPGYSLALVLAVARGEGQPWRIFDTRDFQPPVDYDLSRPKHPLSKIKRGSCW